MMINLNMDNMSTVLQELSNKIASLTLENAILKANLEYLLNEDLEKVGVENG